MINASRHRLHGMLDFWEENIVERPGERHKVKKKFRQIVVNGQTYLWKFTPGYVAANNPSDPWQCQDRFIAYLFHVKASPLKITFLTWEDPMMGGPLRTGLPLDLAEIRSGKSGANLHTPKYAASIIQAALEEGWGPEQSAVPFVIEQGVQWLMQKKIVQ